VLSIELKHPPNIEVKEPLLPVMLFAQPPTIDEAPPQVMLQHPPPINEPEPQIMLLAPPTTADC
jgi:hypothetical protein